MATGVRAVCVVQQPGIPAFALIGKTTSNVVSLIDMVTANQTLTGMKYITRPMQANLPYHMRATMGEQEPRAGRKRVRRVTVFGEGTLTSGSTITVHADTFSETYTITTNTILMSDGSWGVLAYQEFSPAMVGRILTVELNLNGTGIAVRDIRMDYIFVG